MTRIFVLRKPPRMLGRYKPGVASNGKLGPLSYLSSTGLDDDPTALFDAFLCSRIGMDLHDGVLVKLSEPGDLSVFCVEEAGLPHPGNQDVGIFLIDFRCAYRTLNRLLVIG